MLTGPHNTERDAPLMIDIRWGWGGVRPGLGAAAMIEGAERHSRARTTRLPGVLGIRVTSFEAGLALTELALANGMEAEPAPLR